MNPADSSPSRRSREPGGPRDRRWGSLALALGAATLLGACGGSGSVDEEVVFQVPSGASFRSVVDTLEARGLVDHPFLFRVYGRVLGADRSIRSGRYAFRGDASWGRILGALTEGRVLTVALTIPEGFTVRQIAPRIAAVAEVPEDSLLRRMSDPDAARRHDVPGPTLEGYLFPETYRFAPGIDAEEVVATMVDRYRAYWTPRRRARLDSLELTEAEAVTLASVVQAEAGMVEEMDTIASVYQNRLDRGMRLEADPTVLYALGGHRERLLFPAMDSVADHPYNTYTQAGLPPGPIASPGADALDAALWPADTDLLYFVARVGGGHRFSRTLSEHNAAVRQYRQERD